MKLKHTFLVDVLKVIVIIKILNVGMYSTWKWRDQKVPAHGTSQWKGTRCLLGKLSLSIWSFVQLIFGVYMGEAATLLTTASEALLYIIHHLQRRRVLNSTFTFTQLMSGNEWRQIIRLWESPPLHQHAGDMGSRILNLENERKAAKTKRWPHRQSPKKLSSRRTWYTCSDKESYLLWQYWNAIYHCVDVFHVNHSTFC